MIRLAWLILLLSAILPAGRVGAHALEPGYLEITPVAGNDFRVLWRVPDVQGRPMAITARLPEVCNEPAPPAPRYDGWAWSAGWMTHCSGGLTGGTITIDGLTAQRTDVLVRYDPGTGARTERLTPDRPGFAIPDDPGALDVLRTYTPLGIDHILRGLDHLLFVFALLLLIADTRRLIAAITAFTVAHSLTMAAATLGLVTPAGPPVEAVVALSIMFVAAELAQRQDGAERLSQRAPWAVSFAFGLLHGFGFAGALREVGLPETDIPLALLSFNIGVEIGQLIFVAGVLAAGAALRAVVPGVIAALRAPGTLPAKAAAYVIGGVAGVWFVARVAGFVA